MAKKNTVYLFHFKKRLDPDFRERAPRLFDSKLHAIVRERVSRAKRANAVSTKDEPADRTDAPRGALFGSWQKLVRTLGQRIARSFRSSATEG